MTTPEAVHNVFIYHQRTGIGSCLCGNWTELGSSYAGHLVGELSAAGYEIVKKGDVPPWMEEVKNELPPCGEAIRGIYGTRTTCARPKGHTPATHSEHDGIRFSGDWPKLYRRVRTTEGES